MKNISLILKNLGLNDSEVRTYLNALENGASTVIDLAKYASLSRQATYDAIESLTKRGLMTSVTQGKKRYYSAEHPQRLLDYAKRKDAEIEEQVQELERSLPELELQMGGSRPTVKMYEGKEGVRAIIEDIAATKPERLDEIADLDAMYAVLGQEEFKPMRAKLKDVGTIGRGIYSGEPSPKALRDSSRYLLPKERGRFHSNVTIYGNKIALVTFEGKIHSIIIESKPLADAFRILFGLSYETAKKEFPKK